MKSTRRNKEFDFEAESIKLFLNSYGLRATDSTIEIFRTLYDSKHPLTITDLEDKIIIKPYIATIYRILDKLEEADFISKLKFGENEPLYEFKKKPHNHFICQKCHKVIDIFLKDKELEDVKKRVTKNYDIEIKTASINFVGKCEECKITISQL